MERAFLEDKSGALFFRTRAFAEEPVPWCLVHVVVCAAARLCSMMWHSSLNTVLVLVWFGKKLLLHTDRQEMAKK